MLLHLVQFSQRSQTMASSTTSGLQHCEEAQHNNNLTKSRLLKPQAQAPQNVVRSEKLRRVVRIPAMGEQETLLCCCWLTGSSGFKCHFAKAQRPLSIAFPFSAIGSFNGFPLSLSFAAFCH